MSCWYATIIALTMGAPDNASELVSRLASNDPSERDSAAIALETMGDSALPALRAARFSRNRALREPAAQLAHSIEATQLVTPSSVSLTFADQPMSHVITEINAMTECRLTIYEVRKDWLAQRITLHTPAPVPFWRAVDSICEAGHFHYNLGIDPKGCSVALFREYLSGPSSDHGAFRVQIEEIFFNGRYRKLHLGRDSRSRLILNEDDRNKALIKMRVMVEPRMLIRNDGPLKHVSIIDDRGRPLESDENDGHDRADDFGYWTLAHVVLKSVAHPGNAIQRFSGVAPVVVAKRRPDPLVIALADAEGRAYRSNETIVTIRNVRKVVPKLKVSITPANSEGKQARQEPASQATEIELTIRPRDRWGFPASELDVSEDQFEVVDVDGRVWRPSPWWLSDSRPTRDGEEVRIRLIPDDGNLSPWPGNIAGATLRYYDTTVVKVDVPFEFENIALP